MRARRIVSIQRSIFCWELAEAQATPLSKSGVTVPASSDAEPAQLTRVLNHLHKRFQEPIRIDALCRGRQHLAAITPSALCEAHRRKCKRLPE